MGAKFSQNSVHWRYTEFVTVGSRVIIRPRSRVTPIEASRGKSLWICYVYKYRAGNHADWRSCLQTVNRASLLSAVFRRNATFVASFVVLRGTRLQARIYGINCFTYACSQLATTTKSMAKGSTCTPIYLKQTCQHLRGYLGAQHLHFLSASRQDNGSDGSPRHRQPE